MRTSITGRGWAFPPYLDDRNRIAMAEDDVDIRQAIFIILNTVPGERVMRPDFGCQIHELIFAPANEQTAATAERYVTEALNRWEPRIRLQHVSATPSPDGHGSLWIEIVYEIKQQHDVRSLVYPFYLIPS
jgi:phage baseplate assembly protein W